MTTIEIPPELLAAVRRAAAADGTSVPAMVEQALRNLIGERFGRPDPTPDRPDPAQARPYGRMQEVFDSYRFEVLGGPTGGY